MTDSTGTESRGPASSYWFAPPVLLTFAAAASGYVMRMVAEHTIEAAGLWSSPVAFVLTGVTGSAVLWRLWRHGAALPASLFLALLMSSPFLLAYASLAMTEMLGALAQLLVLLAYVRYQQRPEPRRARFFAVSLTVLFFTKYNYFLMLGVPLKAGIVTYFEVLRTTYFYSAWILGLVVGVSVVAALAYRRQPPLMPALIIAIPLQSAAIALHQTRVPRFLLLTVVLLCLASASEVGRWLAGARRGRLAAVLLAAAVLTFGVMGARNVVAEARFRAVAFEHYTDSEPLRGALRSVRDDLTPTTGWQSSATATNSRQLS